MNEQENREEIFLDLPRLLGILLKNGKKLLAAALAGTILTLAAVFFLVTPRYQSTVTMYVSNGVYFEDMASSFSVILKTREMLLQLIQHTESSRTHEQLQGMIGVLAVENTDFFRVVVSSPDPYEAKSLAQAIGELLPERVEKIMVGTTVTVVDKAVLASQPSIPHYPSTALLGCCIGLGVAVCLILVRELLRQQE